MNQDLEKLIELTLADGQLSEKERTVLFRKAKELGVDHDEFEIVLDAKLHQRQQAKTKFEDSVKKCPSCKEPIPALSKVCIACGHVVNVEASSSNSNISLETLIDNIEGDFKELKTIPHPNIFNTIQANMILFFVCIGVVILILDIFIMKNGWAGFIGVIIAFYGGAGAMQYKKKEEEKYGKSESSETVFKSVKASFEKNSRLANTYFGANRNVNKLLTNLKEEITIIESKRQKAKKTTFIILGCLLASIVLGSFLFNSSQPKTSYLIDGNGKTMTGNIGSYFKITDKNSTLNTSINKSDFGSVESYNLHINDVRFTVLDKEKLKKEWSNLVKGCKEDCVNIQAELVLEDENKNTIGLESLILNYSNEENLINYLNSEIDNFQLSFFKDYIKDISLLSNAKNYTISIIITKK